METLSIRDWYDVSAARIDVFVVEQNCPFQDNDGADFRAWHLLGWDESGGKRSLAAYCRLVDAGVKFAEPSIGRVVTPRDFRAKGMGRLLMAEAVRRHDELYPGQPNRIGAQARLERFYRDFGFETASGVYMEDGIPHIEMLRRSTRS